MREYLQMGKRTGVRVHSVAPLGMANGVLDHVFFGGRRAARIIGP